MSEVEKLAKKMALAIVASGRVGEAVPDPGDVEDALPYAEAILKAQSHLGHLLNAVTFGPKSELSPGNVGYAARIPIGFVENAKPALAALRAITVVGGGK